VHFSKSKFSYDSSQNDTSSQFLLVSNDTSSNFTRKRIRAKMIRVPTPWGPRFRHHGDQGSDTMGTKVPTPWGPRFRHYRHNGAKVAKVDTLGLRFRHYGTRFRHYGAKVSTHGTRLGDQDPH